MLKNFLHKRRSITAQTSILITLTIAVALVISALLFYYKTDKELTTHYREQMFQESNTTMNVLSDNIDTIDSIYRLLVSSDTIYSFMASSSRTPSDYIATEKQMTSLLILNNLWEKSYLESVYVYTNYNKRFYVSKNDNMIKREENAAVYRNLTEPSPTLTLHALDGSDDLYFVRTIYNLSSGDVLGTMIVTLNQKSWVNMLTQNISKGWHILMYNNSFETISDYNYDVTSKDRIEALKKSLDYYNDKALHHVKFESKDYLTLSNNLKKIDISATIMAPQNQIKRQVNNVLNSYIIVMFIIIFIVLLISFAISRYITKPVGTMIHNINKISHGNYSEKVSGLEEYEEFYALQVAINYMLDQIHAYHDNVLEQNISLKTAEIKALQSQLNPHFIFNVLNTLAWKAEMSDNSELSQMAITIGEIFKATTAYRNSQYISIAEELKFVKFYIYLQQMRFEDKISVTFDIDKDLDDINIPCFCVQTLVENAYVHGLEPKDTNGHLTISIKKDNENKFLLINIIDDGVGFEKIPKFDINVASKGTTSEAVGSRPHIGLKNLNRRLFLMYGEDAVLHIESIPEVRTAISFKIPL